MKRRVTFIVEQDSAFDPKKLDIRGDLLSVKSLQAAREERWTVGLDILPQELRHTLEQCFELHVRWTSVPPFPLQGPFLSATASGLNIQFTPQRDNLADRLCPLLSVVFQGNLNCTVPEDTFTEIPTTAKKLSSSTALYYHESLSSIESLVQYIQQNICQDGSKVCIEYVADLSSSRYIDLDYDAISQSLTLHAFWDSAPNGPSWDGSIAKSDIAKTEIGVLTKEKAARHGDISLGGYLITLGEDKKAVPTLFSFPSRHHKAPATFIASFLTPTGLHPTLRIVVSESNLSSSSRPSSNCKLYAHLTLPSAIFPDRYQLSQANLLRSNNMISIRSLSPATPDLEAPVWAVQEWGSSLLLELATPSSLSSSITLDSWHVDIPLHLRYLHPLNATSSNSSGGYRNIPVPQPLVFWACPTTSDGPEMDTSPFDRRNLGYDTAFGRRTAFWHFQRSGDAVSLGGEKDTGSLQIEVPVLDLGRAEWVERGTVIAVLLGFVWVCWCLARVALGLGQEDLKSESREVKGAKGKKKGE